MVAFVCDIFCMQSKNVSQYQKYQQNVNKVDFKQVILMSFHVGHTVRNISGPATFWSAKLTQHAKKMKMLL